MAKFNVLTIFFTAFVAVAVCLPMVKQEPKEPKADVCQEEPAVYRSSKSLQEQCGVKQEARPSRKYKCQEEPRVYCDSTLLQELCGKVEFCKTWPGDGVIAEGVNTSGHYWDDVWIFFQQPAEEMEWTK